MTRGHTGECGLCCPCHSAAGGQRRALGTGMGQLWHSAIASPLRMASGCHSLNNPCPTAHSTVTLLQHSHSILSPAESTLSSPRDTGVPRAQRHARSITQTTPKMKPQLQKREIAKAEKQMYFCLASTQTHTGGAAQGACPPLCTQSMQVDLSSSKRPSSSPACFLGRTHGLRSSGDRAHTKRCVGRQQQGNELRRYFLCQR